MKQMQCSDMGGGDCREMIQGNTAEEIVDNGMRHVESAHPEMAKRIAAMSDKEKGKWMADFKKKFDALPEM